MNKLFYCVIVRIVRIPIDNVI